MAYGHSYGRIHGEKDEGIFREQGGADTFHTSHALTIAKEGQVCWVALTEMHSMQRPRERSDETIAASPREIYAMPRHER